MVKKERRKHPRFPIISDLVEPVMLKVSSCEIKEGVPGIMLDLSAGGMVVITFIPLQEGSLLELTINLPGLKIEKAEGKIVRVEEKAGTYAVGIGFFKLSKKVKEKIKQMAKDFHHCKIRQLNGEKNICFKECSYYLLCSQTIKGHTKKNKK
ncbi:PilZ domain-containing protein [bacterium]|nr:PilZ domain-containing protein [bacterium]